jgi:hypothetical protein
MQSAIQQQRGSTAGTPRGTLLGTEMGRRIGAAPRGARRGPLAASPVTSLPAAAQDDGAAPSTSASAGAGAAAPLAGRVARFRATKHAAQLVRELEARSLAEYMALPASQYSVLDARKVIGHRRAPTHAHPTAGLCRAACIPSQSCARWRLLPPTAPTARGTLRSSASTTPPSVATLGSSPSWASASSRSSPSA